MLFIQYLPALTFKVVIQDNVHTPYLANCPTFFYLEIFLIRYFPDMFPSGGGKQGTGNILMPKIGVTKSIFLVVALAIKTTRFNKIFPAGYFPSVDG